MLSSYISKWNIKNKIAQVNPMRMWNNTAVSLVEEEEQNNNNAVEYSA